jgi:uncharacterized protein (TIGR03435 family)
MNGKGYVIAVLVLNTVAAGQDFEVASIRPHPGIEQNYRIRTPPGGRFTATNVSLKTLILEGFDIKDFQLAGLPGSMEGERYDIDARLPAEGQNQATITPEGLRPLLLALLASRFRLKTHRDSKDLTVYALTAARNGLKLHQNVGTPGHSTDWGGGRINAVDVTVAEFGRVLETQLGRAVVDETGIQGTFDFHLNWTPDQDTEKSGPSIFTALQEQYGLRLETAKRPVEILVIDHVEPPSPN